MMTTKLTSLCLTGRVLSEDTPQQEVCISCSLLSAGCHAVGKHIEERAAAAAAVCSSISRTPAVVQEFLEGLLDMYLADAKAAQLDRPLLLAAATVALLGTYPLLAEHAVSLGHVQQLLDLLATCTGSSPGVQFCEGPRSMPARDAVRVALTGCVACVVMPGHGHARSGAAKQVL